MKHSPISANFGPTLKKIYLILFCHSVDDGMAKNQRHATVPFRCLEPKECKGPEALIRHAKLLKTSPPPSQLFKAPEKVIFPPPPVSQRWPL